MLVFVCGAHGSGKSELCKEFVNSHNNAWIHRSASNVIERQLGQRNWDDQKKTNEISQNQRVLLLALEHEKNCGKHVLLDGHFVLRDHNGSITEIPDNVFQILAPRGVVLVEAPPSLILTRLRSRDSVDMSEQEIVALMQHERRRATEVCHALNVQFKIVNMTSSEQFANAVEQVSCEGSLGDEVR